MNTRRVFEQVSSNVKQVGMDLQAKVIELVKASDTIQASISQTERVKAELQVSLTEVVSFEPEQLAHFAESINQANRKLEQLELDQTEAQELLQVAKFRLARWIDSYEQFITNMVDIDNEIAALQELKQWNVNKLSGDKSSGMPKVGALTSKRNSRIEELEWRLANNGS